MTEGLLVNAATFDDLVDAAPDEHADRISRADDGCDANLRQFWSDQGILEFSTQCHQAKSTGPWTQLVQVANWWEEVVQANPEIQDLVLNSPGGSLPWGQIAPYLMPQIHEVDVLVFCDCPDFLYSGANFNVSLDRAVYPGFEEGRSPEKHRTQGLGQARICKHLYAVWRFMRGS